MSEDHDDGVMQGECPECCRYIEVRRVGRSWTMIAHADKDRACRKRRVDPFFVLAWVDRLRTTADQLDMRAAWSRATAAAQSKRADANRVKHATMLALFECATTSTAKRKGSA